MGILFSAVTTFAVMIVGAVVMIAIAIYRGEGQ